jgi:DNA-binding GntR family transcriptional regulator
MDDQFHSAICRLCGHNVISDTLIPLHKKIQRYRRASIADETRMKQMAEEHRAIYDAIAAGDAEQAKKLTQLHVDNARANMLKEKVD